MAAAGKNDSRFSFPADHLCGLALPRIRCALCHREYSPLLFLDSNHVAIKSIKPQRHRASVVMHRGALKCQLRGWKVMKSLREPWGSARSVNKLLQFIYFISWQVEWSNALKRKRRWRRKLAWNHFAEKNLHISWVCLVPCNFDFLLCLALVSSEL